MIKTSHHAKINNLFSLVMDRSKWADPARTSLGTMRVFNTTTTFDLREGFPLYTGKHTNLTAILNELLWFLSGDTNIKTLKSKIWNEWADESGDLGPIYGKQWIRMDDTRIVPTPDVDKFISQGYELTGNIAPNSHGEVDQSVVRREINQIQNLIDGIKKNPNSRRHLLSAWNPCDLPDETISPQANVANGKAALPPCHVLVQCFVEDGYLDMTMYQRSADLFLGVPFNIASYAALLTMIAQQCKLTPRFLNYNTGDTHIYENQLPLVEELLRREDRPNPTLELINPPTSIFNYSLDNFVLHGYEPHGAMRVSVQV